MSEPIFFARAIHMPLADIIAVTGASVPEGAILSMTITGAAPFDVAAPGEITVLAGAAAGGLPASRAAACFVTQAEAALLPESMVPLLVDDPHGAFLQALAKLFPEASRPVSLVGGTGINPQASIHPEARLEHGVIADPGVVIGPGAEIGSGTIIGANSVIGASVRIGRDCAIGPQVTITHALIGDRVTLHPGARIGQPALSRAKPGSRLKAHPCAVPHLGRIIIQDGAVIGANAAIDRGALGDTVIGEGSRIGDLARIAENALIGRFCAIPPHGEVPAGASIEDFSAAPCAS